MELWQFQENPEMFSALVSAYSHKTCHYHTREHLEACLQHLDHCADKTDQLREVELALWFHDSVYKPLSSENESKSAEWAASFLEENGASIEAISRVRTLILATKHEQESTTNDESILLDFDLSILGANPETYEEFERPIRTEQSVLLQRGMNPDDPVLGRLRRLCLMLPETSETASWGHANFRAGKSARSRHLNGSPTSPRLRFDWARMPWIFCYSRTHGTSQVHTARGNG